MVTSVWPKVEFLAWLDATKKQLGLRNDSAFARHVGIGHTLISGWRHDRQRPSTGTLATIATVLGLDPRSLWVLAGLVPAAEAGPALPPPLPVLPPELGDLVTVFYDPRLDGQGRRGLLRQVAALVRAAHGWTDHGTTPRQ